MVILIINYCHISINYIIDYVIILFLDNNDHHQHHHVHTLCVQVVVQALHNILKDLNGA